MLSYYRNLLYDSIRINEFKKAIRSLIDKNSVVAEIGFGLGTYSFFAAMNHAKAIYAIEKGEVFSIGKEIAGRNGFRDKITFYHSHSKNVQLPEKVDFIIMEDYTPMFNYQGLFETIVDTRQRFLKSSGKFIPNGFVLKFALVEYPELYKNLAPDNWTDTNAYDINWEYTTELIFNQAHYASSPGIKMLSDEITLRNIDLINCEDIVFNFSNQIQVTDAGIIHGIIGWWDCWFTPDQYFSNSPNAPANTWGQMFFPFRYPVKVVKNDVITVDFNSYHSKYTEDINYRWALKFKNNQQEHNTFISKIFNRDAIDKFNPERSPELNSNGKIVNYILSNVDGTRSVKDIAVNLYEQFPKQFPSIEQAIVKINDILREFTQ